MRHVDTYSMDRRPAEAWGLRSDCFTVLASDAANTRRVYACDSAENAVAEADAMAARLTERSGRPWMAWTFDGHVTVEARP